MVSASCSAYSSVPARETLAKGPADEFVLDGVRALRFEKFEVSQSALSITKQRVLVEIVTPIALLIDP